MKFSQLADGQQFEYQGVVYTRQGPLMGIDKTGNSRMIPRSAEVVVPDGRPRTTKTELNLQQTISLAKAMNAFADFEVQFSQCINSTGDEQIDVSSIKQCLSDARNTFKSNIASD